MIGTRRTRRPLRAFLGLVASCIGAAASAGGAPAVQPRQGDVPAQVWKIKAQEVDRNSIVNAPILPEERIDVPTGAAAAEGPAYILRPDKTGYILLFLYFDYGIFFEDSEAVALDSVSGQVKRYTLPKTLNLHMGLERGVYDAQGRMYCYFGGGEQLWCFDPATMDFSSVGSPPADILGGGFNRLACGDDGRIYGSTSSKGRVGIYYYDPATKQFHSYGFVGPAHTQGGETHAYTLTARGGYVYFASGKVPWWLVALDTKTGKSEVLLEAPPGNASIWLSGDSVTRMGEKYRLADGKAVKEAPQSARRPPAAPTPPRPAMRREELSPTVDGLSVVEYRLPGEDQWRKVELKVKTYAQSIRRLTALPDGRLLGTVGSYQGYFVYDPATGRSERLQRDKLSHYATVIYDGKVYMSGYPNSPIVVYDPAQPPSPDNPHMVHQLTESWCHKMWAAASGSDGNVYFSGEVARQGNGGGCGWWDPKEKKAGALDYKLFAGYKTLYMCPAHGGDKLVLGSEVTINNLTGETPSTARLFIVDVKEKKLTEQVEPIPGSPIVAPFVEVAPGRILGVACGAGGDANRQDILFGFDLAEGRVAFQKKVPAFFCVFHQGMRGGQEFLLGPDGWLWTYLGPDQHPEHPALVRIHPQTAEVRIVGRVERRGPLAFSGKDLYRGCEHKAGQLKMRRLAGIVDEVLRRDAAFQR